MKLLLFSDLHNDTAAVRRLVERAGGMSFARFSLSPVAAAGRGSFGPRPDARRFIEAIPMSAPPSPDRSDAARPSLGPLVAEHGAGLERRLRVIACGVLAGLLAAGAVGAAVSNFRARVGSRWRWRWWPCSAPPA